MKAWNWVDPAKLHPAAGPDRTSSRGDDLEDYRPSEPPLSSQPVPEMGTEERQHLVAVILEYERQIAFWQDQTAHWMTLFAQVVKDRQP